MGKTFNTALLLFIAQDSGGVQARLVIDTTPGITNGYNFTSFVMEETGSNGTCITISLDTDTSPFERHTKTSGSLASDKQYAGGSCIITTLTTTNRERLTCDDCRTGEALMHGIGIHNPGHDLRICIDIWCWNITSRTNNDRDFSGITASHAL